MAGSSMKTNLNSLEWRIIEEYRKIRVALINPSKVIMLVLLISCLNLPLVAFADPPESSEGLSWTAFYMIAIGDWIIQLPKNIRDSWLSTSDAPETVVGTVIRAVEDENNAEFKRLTGDPETGAFGYFDKADLDIIRSGKYAPGLSQKLSEDQINLIQYQFDRNVATCLKLEKFEVELLQNSSPKGTALVKCYSDYKIYRATGKSETTMPYFKTKVQECPDPKGNFENRRCSVVKIDLRQSEPQNLSHEEILVPEQNIVQ